MVGYSAQDRNALLVAKLSLVIAICVKNRKGETMRIFNSLLEFRNEWKKGYGFNLIEIRFNHGFIVIIFNIGFLFLYDYFKG